MRTLLLAVLVVACGPGQEPDEYIPPPPPPPPAPTLAGGFAGGWQGATTVAFDGLNPVAYNSQLQAAVNGTVLAMNNICPDGSGVVTMNGANKSAQWTGAFSCPPVSWAGCPALTLTYTSASATLNANGTLSLQGSGNGEGCGTTRALSTSFTGSR